MSVIVNLKQVSPATLDFLVENPFYLNFIFYELDSTFQPKPRELLAVMTGNDEIKPTDTDKAWGGILYLLGNFPDIEGLPVTAAVNGHKDIKPGIYDDEPDRYLTSKEVKTLAQVLTTIAQNEFLANFDSVTMQKLEIYPAWWWKKKIAKLIKNICGMDLPGCVIFTRMPPAVVMPC